MSFKPPTRSIKSIVLLVLSLGLFLLRPVAQHHLRLRPSPSEHLPVPDLKEDPDPEYDPREQDLSERTLRKKLGSNFDPNFMSIGMPPQFNSSSTAQAQQDAQLARVPGPMPNDIKKLDLTETPYGKRLKVGKKARRKFLQLLWTYTYCPVLYTWKDLGARFWPRYIKEGNCFNERSCSFPEGMFCKPVKSVTKTFLRWYCQGFLRQKYCTWIPVQYPIISECKCSC
ncbi:noggin-2 [Chanos chanos]|uniref:Noggin n=1 Tax=Chanos chanos TaxID=29144 RepID=A0A6J2V2M2_CHACN|nr:noggin-2-like [Chanos chanos]